MSATAAPEQAPTRFRPMQAPSLPSLIAVLAIVAVAAVIVAAGGALVMIGFGFAGALVTLPLVDWLERHGVRRSIGALLVVTGLLLCVGAVVLVCASVVLDQGPTFVAAIPTALETIHAQYTSLSIPAWLRSMLDVSLSGLGGTIAALDPSQVAFGLVQGVVSVAGLIGGLAVIPFFMYYVLVDEPRTRSRFDGALPSPWRLHAANVVEIFRRDFADYFRAEFVVGGIVGVAVAVGMFAIGAITGGPLAEFALLLGILAAVLELLPSVGPAISYIPALLLAVVTSPTAVVLVSIYYFVVFNIEGSYLVPSVEGKIVDFDRATVLVILAAGFGLAGFIGGVLALPLAAIGRDLFGYAFRVARTESAIPSVGDDERYSE